MKRQGVEALCMKEEFLSAFSDSSPLFLVRYLYLVKTHFDCLLFVLFLVSVFLVLRRFASSLFKPLDLRWVL